MARVKDIFTKRDGGSSTTETCESSPEAAGEQRPAGKQSAESCRADGSSSGPAAADHCTSNSPTEKPESCSPADLTGGDSATDTSEEQSHDDSASAEKGSISETEESSRRSSDSAAEAADAVVSAPNSSSSFTFGTVVAPLYHQVSGRVGSESQSVSDGGNPEGAALNGEEFTGNSPQTESEEIGFNAHTVTRGKDDRTEEDLPKTSESKQDDAQKSAHIEGQGSSLSVTENGAVVEGETVQEVVRSGQRCTNTSDVPKAILEDAVAHTHAASITPTESLHLGGEAQEDGGTHDLQSQTTAEPAELQPPEFACTQIKTKPSETCGREEVTTREESSLIPTNNCSSDKDNDSGELIHAFTNNGLSEEDKPSEVSHDLNPNHINNLGAKTNEDNCVSSFEIVEQTSVTTSPVPLEIHQETNDVEEVNKQSDSHTHGDACAVLKDEDALKYEKISVSEKLEDVDTQTVSSNQEDVCLVDNADAKNWEMMVEEEEINILTDEDEIEVMNLEEEEKHISMDGDENEEMHSKVKEKNILTDEDGNQVIHLEEEEKNILTNEDENEVMHSKGEDNERVEEDQEEELEDAGTEAASDNRDVAEDEMMTRAANQTQHIETVEHKQRVEEEQTVAEEDREKDEEESEAIQTAKLETAGGEEEPVEEFRPEKREEEEQTESEQEEHSVEMVDRMSSQEEEETEEKEIDLHNHSENTEKENPDYNEEVLVDDKGKSETVEAELESLGDQRNELRCLEERLEITANQAEDDSSAWENNVQEVGGAEEEDPGEQVNSHVPAEEFPAQEDAAHESESTAAEEGSYIYTEELEGEEWDRASSETDSDSDDEVELYMHCLRAVHAGPQAQGDRSKDAGFPVARRASANRAKLLSTPMPSITESLDEEPHPSLIQDSHKDIDTEDFQAVPEAQPELSGQQSISRNVSWWTETFTCSNISKLLLLVSLFVVFVVVAYHYDFLACLGLYLVSVVWLYCQGDKQPVKPGNNRIR